MRRLRTSAAAVATAFRAGGPLGASAPVAGDSLTEGGWGHLVIGGGPDPRVRIDSTGVNGHSCPLDGNLRRNIGGSAPGDAACTVRFGAVPGEVEVMPIDHDACRGQCGDGARVDGVDVVPAAGCDAAVRRRVVAEALDRYRAVRWRQSADPLAALLARCAKTPSPEKV